MRFQSILPLLPKSLLFPTTLDQHQLLSQSIRREPRGALRDRESIFVGLFQFPFPNETERGGNIED